MESRMSAKLGEVYRTQVGNTVTCIRLLSDGCWWGLISNKDLAINLKSDIREYNCYSTVWKYDKEGRLNHSHDDCNKVSSWTNLDGKQGEKPLEKQKDIFVL